MTCETERWCAIAGFEGVYEVSSCGNVRRLTTRGGRILDGPRRLKLSPTADKQGRLRVSLWLAGKASVGMVATLVAETFIGKRPQGDHVDHINRENTDNRVCNLRFLSASLNSSNPGSLHPNAKLTEEQVSEIRQHLRRLAQQYGISPSTFAQLANGRSWRHVP